MGEKGRGRRSLSTRLEIEEGEDDDEEECIDKAEKGGNGRGSRRIYQLQRAVF